MPGKPDFAWTVMDLTSIPVFPFLCSQVTLPLPDFLNELWCSHILRWCMDTMEAFFSWKPVLSPRVGQDLATQQQQHASQAIDILVQ